MSKLTYIQKRFLINRLKMEKLQRNYNREMLKRYNVLANNLYKEIHSWVERYADNEAINVDAAYEILSKDDQKKWSMSLQEFRKKAIEGGYSQELNREYFKSRINRLEHLSNQLYTELVEYAAKEDQHLSDYLKDHYEEAYLRNIYELTDRGSFVVPFDRYSSKQLEQVISKPWLGSNFSKRVWRNLTKKLPDALEKTMSQAVTLGWGTDKIVNAMMKEVGTFARSRMTTLVQTEAAHIAERATDRSFEEMGVKQWEWLATLESHTCLRCGELDGKIFDRDDPKAPVCPLHPNCRCTRIPVVEGFKELHRWQRDPITGKGKIEKNMSFAEWKEKVVNEQENHLSKGEYGANLDYVRSKEFNEKLKRDDRIGHIADKVAKVSRQMLQHRNGTPYEDYYLLDLQTGKTVALSNKARKTKGVVYNDQVKNAFKTGNEGQYVSIHNHPSGYPPSLSDIASLSVKSKNNTVGLGLTIGHDGSVYWYTKNNIKFDKRSYNDYSKLIEKLRKIGYNEVRAQELALLELSQYYGFNFGKVGE